MFVYYLTYFTSIAKSGTTRPPLVQLTFSAPSAPVGGSKLPYLPDCPAFE
ncbi:hypothetical protein PoMZ_08160 [Pyricularia oryzae]|uniref:Uncharacterized protein n=1 Tax=Pyricularia oryzae TaxID=318829 RepID=A0A4P7NGX0_PYROR|nr:hypothetical protein PoMZ_08160 [Pyricularia oryzae]